MEMEMEMRVQPEPRGIHKRQQHLAHWQSVVHKYWPRASQVSAIQTMDKTNEEGDAVGDDDEDGGDIDEEFDWRATGTSWNLLTNIYKST